MTAAAAAATTDSSTTEAQTSTATAKTTQRRCCRYCGVEDVGSTSSWSSSSLLRPPRSTSSFYRCANCRTAWYCSKSCQKRDWKNKNKGKGNGDHRTECRALRAQRELAELLRTRCSLEDAGRDFSKAVVAIEELKQRHKDDEEQKAAVPRTTEPAATPAGREEKAARRRPSSSSSSSKAGAITTSTSTSTIRRRRRQLGRPRNDCDDDGNERGGNGNSNDDCQFTIQHMPNLCCYQATLRIGSVAARGFERDGARAAEEVIETRLIRRVDGGKLHGEGRHVTAVSFRRRRCDYYNDDDKIDPKFENLLSLRVPGEIHEARAYSSATEDGTTYSLLSIRLPYRPTTVSEDSFFSADHYAASGTTTASRRGSISNPAEAQTVCCRSCGYRLIKKGGCSGGGSGTIDRVLPMPSGRYDDIFPDYMICYPGQPVVDIGTTATTLGVREGCLLQDETTVVLHAKDVDGASVSTKKPGYGHDAYEDSIFESLALPDTGVSDETAPSQSNDMLKRISKADPTAVIRGIRPWRDSVGGATLACDLCSSTLGFAQEEGQSYRILKHRVQWKTSQECDDAVEDEDCDEGEDKKVETKVEAKLSSSTVSDFIAHEMIRYAETKAIFALQVLCEHRHQPRRQQQPSFLATTSETVSSSSAGTNSCLWLRLLSWDTRAATGKDCWVDDDSGKQHYETDGTEWNMDWYRLVQVMYEEETVATTIPTSSTPDGGEWMSWTTAKDWCCPPPVPTATKAVKEDEDSNDNAKEALKESPTNATTADDGTTPVPPTSVVRLWLSPEEYEELRRALETGSNFYYSDEVKRATIAAKTGTTSSAVELAAFLVS